MGQTNLLNSDQKNVVKHYSSLSNVYVQIYKDGQKYLLQILFEIGGKKKTLTLAEFTL